MDLLSLRSEACNSSMFFFSSTYQTFLFVHHDRKIRPSNKQNIQRKYKTKQQQTRKQQRGNLANGDGIYFLQMG